MRFWLGLAVVLLAATFVGAGNEELERLNRENLTLTRESLKTSKEFTTILETIKDKKTAEDAKARLLSVVKRLGVLEEKMNALSQALDRQYLQLRLEEKREKELREKHAQELKEKLPKELKEQPDFFLTVLKESLRLKKLPGVLEVFRGTPLFWDFFGQSRADWARADVVALTRAVDAYHVRHGQLPESLAVLTKAEKGQQPFVEATALLDPWNRPYVYEPNTLDSVTGRPLIYSQGTNPSDPASRIRNWGSESKKK